MKKNTVQPFTPKGQCALKNSAQPVEIESQTDLDILTVDPLRDQVRYDLRAYRTGWYDHRQRSEIQNETSDKTVWDRAIEKAESDVALGCSLLCSHAAGDRSLSPRNAAASKVLQAIGSFAIEIVAKQSRQVTVHQGYTQESLRDAKAMLIEQVTLYIQHLEPCEVKPMEATLAALALSNAPATLTDKTGAVEAVPRFAAQEAAIVREIESQGYDPQALEKNSSGKPGIKAAVRKALKRSKLLSTVPIFDKAWERLLKTDAVSYKLGIP